MKILIATHHLYEYTGTEIFTAELAYELKKRGHEIIVFSPTTGSIAEEVKAHQIKVVSNLALIEKEKFDIIHAQHNIIAIMARSIFPNTPMIFMSHGTLAELEQPPTINLAISQFIAVSEAVAQNLHRHYGISLTKITIVRNFIDTNKFFPQKKINNRPKKILVISNHYREDVQKVIESAGRDLHLRVLHIGQPENPVSNVEEYINDADLVVTIGRGALEAMACARNVIVYDIHGGDGFIDTNNFYKLRQYNFSGRLFRQPYSVKDFKKELRKYDPNLGLKLRKLVVKENSPDITISKLEQIYEHHRFAKVSSSQIKPHQLYQELSFLEQYPPVTMNLDLIIQEKELTIQHLHNLLSQKKFVLAQKNREITAIKNSLAWKILNYIHKLFIRQ